MATLELFEATGITLEGQQWRFHVTGRYLVVTEYGWRRTRARREVWHFEDDHIASSYAEAEAYFLETCGERTKHNQWCMCQGKEIKPLRKGRR